MLAPGEGQCLSKLSAWLALPREVSNAAQPVPESHAIRRWLDTGRCWHVVLGAGFRGTVPVSSCWDQTALFKWWDAL